MTERNAGADQRPTDTDAQRRKDTSDHDVVVAAGGATVGQQMKLHTPGCPCLGNAVEVRPPTDGERRSREWCETCKGDVTQTPSFDAYNALADADPDDLEAGDVDRGDGIETDGGQDLPPELVGEVATDPRTDGFIFLARADDGQLFSMGRVDDRSGEEESELLAAYIDALSQRTDSDRERVIRRVVAKLNQIPEDAWELDTDDSVDRGDGIETDGGRDSPKGALRITLDRDDINALLDDGTKVVEKEVGPITVNLRTHQQLNAVVTVSGRRKDPDPERVDE